MLPSNKIAEALSRFDEERIPPQPPTMLPLIEDYRNKFFKADRFLNLDVLFIQHHLGPFIPKLRAMMEEGLDPYRCWFVDIPYSTNDLVIRELVAVGYRKNQMTERFNDPLADYAKNQSGRVAVTMRNIANRSNPRPLLVIDDGAYFVRFMADEMHRNKHLAALFRDSLVVEQTTRGHRFLEECKSTVIKEFDLSVVSIARCQTKVEFESPFIGAAVSRALAKNIGEDHLENATRIAVIGYGPVGKATVKRLLTKVPTARIDVIDCSPDKRREAEAGSSRCKAMYPMDKTKSYELVFGCTGYNSFKLGQRKLLCDGAILASGSSAAIEFNRSGFVELADQYPNDEIEVLDREETIEKGIHAPIRFRQEGGKEFTFLSAGFPVNFDGQIECLPARVIQATHCLLYAASDQVVTERKPGLHSINKETDEWIFAQTIKHL
jgi:S-adenosylhomocysteine hydrolase